MIKDFLATGVRRAVYSLPALTFLRYFGALTTTGFSEKGMLNQAFTFAQLNEIRGDYMEFGLWRGRTFLFAHRLKWLYRLKDMHLWGFDSFQGLPTVEPGPNEIWSTGQFSCSEHELRSTLFGMRQDEFTLVPGFYERSLSTAQHEQMLGRTAAIVYIDCDLYESTVQVLAFIERYLINGTIVCFDDFYCYAGRPDQGEQRALSEFLAAHPDIDFRPYLTYCPVGQSFIVYRRSHCIEVN
jgi:hypothetical protein